MRTNVPQTFEPIFSFALLILVCVLSFGIYLPRLGFYWDDYASIYVAETHGREVFTAWFGGQGRPVGGAISAELWAVFGYHPLPWHALNFLLYLVSVWLFWRILRLLWSDSPTLTTLGALLFAVYPSYHLRPIIISFNLISSLDLLLFSFWLSLEGLKRDNLVLGMLAGVCLPLYGLIYEQPILYELLRPLALLYIAHHLKCRERWLKFFLPVILGGIAFVVYRSLIFEANPTYASYNEPLYLNNLDGWLLMFKLSVVAPFKLLALDWVYMPWRVFWGESGDFDVIGAGSIIFLGVGLVYLLVFPLQKRFPPLAVWLMIILAWLGIALLLLPVHLVGRVLTVGFDSRWALIPSPLAALALMFAIPHLIRPFIHAQVILLLLVVVGLGTQMRVNQVYAQDWALRQDLGWQLRWRAPHLAKNTFITIVFETEDLAFDRRVTDYEFTSHFNFFFAGKSYPHVVGSDSYSVAAIFAEDLPRQGQWSQVISSANIIFRDWNFDTQNLAVFGYDGGCLYTANLPLMSHPHFRGLAANHHLTYDDSTPTEVQALMQPEPPHTWCYYFQQVQFWLDLGDLETALHIAQTTEELGFAPREGREDEWLPLIEAYRRNGFHEDADRLAEKLRFINP